MVNIIYKRYNATDVPVNFAVQFADTQATFRDKIAFNFQILPEFLYIEEGAIPEFPYINSDFQPLVIKNMWDQCSNQSFISLYIENKPWCDSNNIDTIYTLWLLIHRNGSESQIIQMVTEYA